MNQRIYDILKNDINEYKSNIAIDMAGNEATFKIFDYFFHKLMDDKDKKISDACGVEFITPIMSNLIASGFDISADSENKGGVGFMFKFDGTIYTMNFVKYKQGSQMVLYSVLKSKGDVNYSGKFMYRYLLYCALEESNMKGSYFTMPRDGFEWDIKTIEERTFDDIYLPEDITEDLKLFVDIFDESDRILRYLKVGNPGVGKTESTIVIANELNKKGVTIIKTPICRALHDKVQLANVLAPALIIFDDIDLSLGSRNSGSYSQLMGDFLDVMDGTDKLSKDVGVIATTNAAHLLDLAAQRPGRFDKTLLFDNITEDNIKNIIAKSLKSNFGVTEGEDYDKYTDSRVIAKFYEAGVTGSHIYNAIKMLKLRYDTLKVKNVTVDRIIKSIQMEITVIDKVRKTSYLNDKFDRNSGSIGFALGSELMDNEEIEADEEVVEQVKFPDH